MAELFTDLLTSYVDGTISATNHAGAHNAASSAANLLKVRTNASFTRVWNVENPPYNAVADSYFKDGVANGTTTFTSATANFTSADNGKNIVLMRGGASSLQDQHTTVTFVNSTTVTLANSAQRSQSNVRFYLSRGGDQTTAIQTAINDASTAGGGTVLLPGVGYLTTGLVMKERVHLRGAGGKRSTMLHLSGSANAPVIAPDMTADNSAVFWKVSDLLIDGNRARQTNASTTVSSTYTAGATTMVLVGTGAGWLPTGVIEVGTPAVGPATNSNPRYTYFSLTNNGNNTFTLGTVLGDYENTTDVGASAGATVTHFNSPGVYISQLPASLDAGSPVNADWQEPTVTIENVMIKNTKGDGIVQMGASDVRLRDILCMYAEQCGVRPSWDTYMSDINVGEAGRYGFMCRGSQQKLVNCQAYFAGGSDVQPHGAGYLFEGPTSLEEGGRLFAACASQDNRGAGMIIRNAQRVMGQMFTSSNGRWDTTGEAYVGCHLVGASNGVLDLVSTDRFVWTPNTVQKHALEVLTGAFKTQNMNVRVSHKAAAGATVGTAIKSGSDLSGGNNISVNSQGSYKVAWRSVTGLASTDVFTSTGHGFVNTDQVYLTNLTGGTGLTAGTNYFIISATTNTFQVSLTSGGSAVNFTTDLTAGVVTPSNYTPDPYDAEVHELIVGGSLTINAPANAHLGTKLRFVLIQDSTGSRATAFNAALPAVWGPSLAGGASNVVEFQYNGTAWAQTNPDPSSPITKVLTADVTNSTVTVTTMTDLDFPVNANSDYRVEYSLMYSSAATTTGLGLQVGVSGSTPASIAYEVYITGVANTDAAGVATTGISGDVFYGLGTAIDDQVLSTGVVAAATVYPAKVLVNFRTGATGGTVSLKQRSEVAASAITIKRGSMAILYPG
jgi:hypothetical protein